MLKSKVSSRNPLSIKSVEADFIGKARVSAKLKPWVSFYFVELNLRFRNETLYFSFAKIIGGCKFNSTKYNETNYLLVGMKLPTCKVVSLILLSRIKPTTFW